MSAPDVPIPDAEPSPDAGGGSPLSAVTEHPFVQQHPEALVGGAFVGAFVLAKLLKAIGN